MNNMKYDEFRLEFGPGEFQEFLNAQKELEANSVWIEGVKDLSASAVETGMDVLEILNQTGNQIPKDLLDDTADHSCIILNYDLRRACLRDCGMPSLQKRIGFWGPGYGWVSKNNLAVILTKAFEGVRGTSKLLLRGEKISAVLSESYAYMPVTELLDAVMDLELEFGQAEFLGGAICHDRTHAKFRFPESAQDITDAYNTLLASAGKQHKGLLTPVVEFRSSDTGVEAARLIPFLEPDSRKYNLIPLVEGISVNHQNSPKYSCMEKFKLESQELFAKMNSDIQSLVPAMLAHQIHYPGNAVIGICNHLRIPQKWGGLVEEDVQAMYPVGCSFLDLFMALTEATSYAIQEGYSPQSTRIINLEEGLAKVSKNRQLWTKFDLPGTVNWITPRTNQ